jgi:hypothetical protein
MDKVERYAVVREALDKDAFVRALNGLGVLVRLDERGGTDEPAPWAFKGSGLALPDDVPLHGGDGDDVFVDRSLPVQRISANDSTITGPAFSLSLPPARGAATCVVVPLKESVVIGRDAGCDVRVAERSISKKHARIVSTTRELAIADAGSQNGTRINGRPLDPDQRHPLFSGDVIDLGDVAVLFLDVDGFYDGLPRLVSG